MSSTACIAHLAPRLSSLPVLVVLGARAGEGRTESLVHAAAGAGGAQGRSMPTPRWGPGVAWSGNHLYAIGGFDLDGTPLSTVESYDPATNTWQERAPMPGAGSHPAVGTLADGRIIVAGGGPPPAETADAELYTPSSNTWQRLTPLPVATIPTGAVVGNTFYVLSGFVGGPSRDVTTSVWGARVPPVPPS